MLTVNELLNSTVGNASASATKLGDDFDTFLNLLTTQLQAQDPLDPVDSSEFTNQLVQFSNVEQAIEQNKNLENLAALTALNGISANVGYIGRTVTVEQAEASFDGTDATWIYELEGAAFRNDLVITDTDGQAVRNLTGETSAGKHTLVWDGTDDSGNTVPPGTYTLRQSPVDANNTTIPNRIFMQDLVSAVDFDGGESLLVAGNFRIPSTEVISVTS